MSSVVRSLTVVVALTGLSVPALADEAARLGSFLPLTNSPGTQAGVVTTFGTYDAARESAGVQARVLADLPHEIQIASELELADEVNDTVEVQYQLLGDEEHRHDVQLAAGWSYAGVNDVPCVFASVAAGRAIDSTYILASLRYDQGLEDGERGGRLGLAGLREVGSDLYAGVDTQLDVDLEKGADEPMNESLWSVRAAPVVTYSYLRLAVTASAGFASQTSRDGAQESGLYAAIGLGAAL